MGNTHKIYLASSWRNQYQPKMVETLQAEGHDVYDFRNPPNGSGFGWEQLDPNWESWPVRSYREALRHPIAEAALYGAL